VPNLSDNAELPQSPVMAEDAVVSPLLMFEIFWRRRYSILLTAIVLGVLAIGFAMRLPPAYVGTASVLLQERKSSVTDSPTTWTTIATDAVAVRTQADILHSPDLAREVVRKFHLADMPEFSPHPRLLTRVLDQLCAIDPFGIMDRLGYGDAAGPAPMTPAAREEYAIRALLEDLSIGNDGRSYVLDIKVKIAASETLDPAQAAVLSAELANAYADIYVKFTGKIKSDSIRQANSLFDDRIAILREKMQVAEHAVETYREQNGLIEDRTAGVEGRSVTNAGQQMARLNLDLSAAVSDRAKKEASLAQITTARPGSEDLQSVPEVVSSPLIQRLREQQAELGAKEAGLAMSRGWSSPELSAVHASQRDVATQIALETAKIAASLRSAVAAARNTEDALRAQLARLQSQVGAQGQTEVKLHELQNEADVAKMIYAAYLKGSEETANQIDSQEPDAIVVARAGVPIGEAPPTRQQLAGVGVLISVVLALLQALVRERRQSGFRTSEDLEAAVGIKTLALVPRVRQLRDAMRFSNPKSMFPEAINSIRALLRLNIRNGSNVLMVTSAAPQEGKTVLSTSLARSAALAGDRVLLVDCDLRRPAVSRYISSVDEQVVDNVTIRRDSLSSLSVITLTPDGGSPQDFFASAKMATLMATLRARYDLIVLDTPPVLAVTDARVLSALADVTILVVGWRKTPRKLVGKAVAELRSSGAQLAGTVITQVRLSDLEATDAAQAYIRRHYAKYVAS
jgi:capsular exopolysaccharide synthesis family protein